MVYWVNYGFSKISHRPQTSYMWRVPTIMQCAFLIPMIFLTLLIPETPRWLAGHDQIEECHEIVRRMHRGKLTHEEIKAEHDLIVRTVAAEASAGAASWKDLIRTDGKLQHINRRKTALTNFRQLSTREEGSSLLVEYKYSSSLAALIL
jgi:hypothetical protein